MQLSSSDHLLWGAGTLLEVILCVLIVRRGLYRRLPFFSTYLALVFARSTLMWWAYRVLGYGSPSSFYIAWITQGILLLARGLAVAELCWSSLRAYRGIWALTWRLLAAIALALVVHAGLSAAGNRSWIAPFVLTAERGLELAAVGILVLLLAACRYYEIRLELVQKMILLGLGFYSAIQVLNNSFMREWLTQFSHSTPSFYLWNGIRLASFQVALVIWLLALRNPLPAAAPAPALLPQEVYDDLAPQVNYRLRLLNQRLLEMLKS